MTYTVDRLPYHTGELLMVYANHEYIGSVTPVGSGFCGKPFVCAPEIFGSENEAIEFVKKAEANHQSWRSQFSEVAA